jgi:pyruvate,water dikinase
MFTKNFKQLNKNNADIAGGKGASLGEMTNAGIPVPPGFVVLSTTFDKFIEVSKLDKKIDVILKKVKADKNETVESASEEIRELIMGMAVSSEIISEIESEFKKLGAKYIAVRSSATAEDGAEHAWAGQLESYLNTTENDLFEKVKKCWASLFTPRAIFYRIEKKLSKQKISVAVVMQKMIESEVSGVAFSVHPVTEDRNQLIIEAGYGLGEAIVSGSITPDSYVVDKVKLKSDFIEINIATQEKQILRSVKGGVEWVEVATAKQEKQKLDDKQIIELSKMIINIEKHYGFPCDIEWAFEKGKFYIVQSRPITTLNV